VSPGEADRVGARARAARGGERERGGHTASRRPEGAALKNAGRRRQPATTGTTTRSAAAEAARADAVGVDVLPTRADGGGRESGGAGL